MKLCIHDCHGKCYHPCQNKGKWIQAALFWPTRCFAWREQQQELFEIICWTCCLVQLQKGSNQLQYSATHDPARTPQRPQEPIPPTVSEVCMVKHGRTCHVVKVISNGFACRLHSISQQCIRKCLYTPVTLRCVHGLTLPMLAGGGHCLWLSMKCDGWRLDHRERWPNFNSLWKRSSFCTWGKFAFYPVATQLLRLVRARRQAEKQRHPDLFWKSCWHHLETLTAAQSVHLLRPKALQTGPYSPARAAWSAVAGCRLQTFLFPVCRMPCQAMLFSWQVVLQPVWCWRTTLRPAGVRVRILVPCQHIHEDQEGCYETSLEGYIHTYTYG